jgi:beta-glucanase (GH16 family)
MKTSFLFVILFFYSLFAASSGKWKLVWADEFDYTGLPEKTKWGYDVGCSGWGNQELENYTKEDLDNAKAENGTLVITARKEKTGQCDYSSARLVTKNKGDWVYGRFEIAAKLPTGRGLWPAIWMLPTDNAYGIWPKSGELDIMENVGFAPFNVHFNIHTEAYNHTIGTNKGATMKLDDPHTKFNVYAMEWFKDHIDFFANDSKAFTFKNEGTGSKVWPYDKRFHLLLNIAVGGSWGGQQGVDDTIFPKSMIVDYVRVYEQDTSGVHVVRSDDVEWRQPPLRLEKGRLVVSSKEFKIIGLRILTIDGKLLADFSRPREASNGEYAIILPRGAFIVVVNDGSRCRTIPLANVY